MTTKELLGKLSAANPGKKAGISVSPNGKDFEIFVGHTEYPFSEMTEIDKAIAFATNHVSMLSGESFHLTRRSDE